MVKLATAREIRTYGPRLGRSRAEYINAGLYLFATMVLIGGFTATRFSWEPRSGLVLILLALAFITAVNVHDLVAHLAGIDYRLRLMEFDLQLGLVEFAVPLVQIAGSIVFFLGIFFVFNQAATKLGYGGRERHALNMLIAGPLLWVIGSIHNSCQMYERAETVMSRFYSSVFTSLSWLDLFYSWFPHFWHIEVLIRVKCSPPFYQERPQILPLTDVMNSFPFRVKSFYLFDSSHCTGDITPE